MKAKYIERDQYLVYDPNNTNHQIENGINVVYVRNVYKKNLRYHVEVYVVENNTGVLHDDVIIDIKSNIRGEIPMFEPLIPGQSVVIRYPEDMPIITEDDCLLVAKMAGKIFTENGDNKGFSDEEIIRINALVKKMKFYSDPAGRIRNMYNFGEG